MKNAVPPIGRPISPSSMHWRAVCCAPPRNVSGAQPTRSPLAAAASIRPARFGERDAERLFRVHVLAGRDRLQADFDMRLRHREIENDLDGRVGENRIDGARGKAEFGRARFRRRGIEVRQGDDVEDGEFFRRGQIGRADVAAADDADSDPFHHESPATEACGSRMGAGPVVPQGAP